MPAVSQPPPSLVLLPGMDGTGELFQPFVRELPDWLKSRAVRYPADQPLSNVDLKRVIQSAVPTETPYLLVAESFSTPLAIQFAATQPLNLKGLVLCNGFASSPVKGWQGAAARLLGSVLFRLPLTNFVMDRYLLGGNPDESLRGEIRMAIRSVEPGVLSARLAAVLDCDVRIELTNIRVPILYLRAKNDRLIGVSCLAEILREQPSIAVEEIAGPHLLLQREPQRTAAVVERFVRSELQLRNSLEF